jgi:predicted phage terminase large subunit-like protein
MASGAQNMNVLIVIDPASAKKKGSDYTAGWVLGLASDKNIYVLDVVRDRLSLTQRADLVMNWHRRWDPIAIGYEHYGMMADIEHIRDRQDRENYRFGIIPLGGSMPKVDRIRRLIPWFEQGRIYMPEQLTKTNYEGVPTDLIRDFIEQEYDAFPVAAHDDMLDALARILDDDMPSAWPMRGDSEYAAPAEGRSNATGY